MIYQVNGFIKHSELDNYENGCSGIGQSSYIPQTIQAATIPELMQKCLEFTQGELFPDLIEPCRLDFQVMENADGMKASDREMERFRNGEINLWLCDYSCLVDMVEAADLTEAFAGIMRKC